MPGREKLYEFTAWCAKYITGDERFRSVASAQIFLDPQNDWIFPTAV